MLSISALASTTTNLWTTLKEATLKPAFFTKIPFPNVANKIQPQKVAILLVGGAIFAFATYKLLEGADKQKKSKQANEAIIELRKALPPPDTSEIKDFSPILEKLIKCLQKSVFPLFDSKYPYMKPLKKKFKEIFGPQDTDLFLLIQDKTGKRAKKLFNQEISLGKLNHLATKDNGILALLTNIEAFSDAKV